MCIPSAILTALTQPFSEGGQGRSAPMRALPKLNFDPAAAAELACPICLGSLCADPARLVCSSCGRVYPIVDGIPVLIAQRADQEAVSRRRD